MKALAQLLNDMRSAGVVQEYALFGVIGQCLLERQIRWQRPRRALPWPEKVRIAEMIRESASHLRANPGTENRGNTSDRDN